MWKTGGSHRAVNALAKPDIPLPSPHIQRSLDGRKFQSKVEGSHKRFPVFKLLGVNYLAGFLLVTIADAVLAERDCAINGGTAAPGASAEGGRGTEVTPREMEVIETECVQVMLGMIAIQGGILSKDLWGLHAVRDKHILVAERCNFLPFCLFVRSW